MPDSADLNDTMLAVLASWPGEWFTADLMQRQVRAGGHEASLMLVGRRLSRLAQEGRCEREGANGMWKYRAGASDV